MLLHHRRKSSSSQAAVESTKDAAPLAASPARWWKDPGRQRIPNGQYPLSRYLGSTAQKTSHKQGRPHSANAAECLRLADCWTLGFEWRE